VSAEDPDTGREDRRRRADIDESEPSATAAVWSVYLLRCGDGSIYTGIATDVARRLEEHRSGLGRGAKYLRGRGPLTLLARESVGSRGRAQSVEARLKRLPREEKERLAADPAGLAKLVAEIGAHQERPSRCRALRAR
jgi:putative endonuclease